MIKILTFIIVVVVLAGGVWFLKGQNESQQDIIPSRPDSEATQGEAEVVYTDAGYSPKDLRVKAGTTVVYKNQSSGPMWTASNIHPTHSILPEFDAKTSTPVGESYSFTFTKNGEWKYHNHLKPNHGAAIIVE